MLTPPLLKRLINSAKIHLHSLFFQHELRLEALESLVLKYKLAKITNTSHKKEAWNKIYPEYTKETGEKIDKDKLQKRWYNEIDKLKKHQRTFTADLQKTGEHFESSLKLEFCF